MNKIQLSMLVDLEEVLELSEDQKIIKWLEKKGYACVPKSEQSKYINLEKSLGTEAFYQIITDAIESGKLSLELIIGHATVKNLLKNIKDNYKLNA